MLKVPPEEMNKWGSSTPDWYYLFIMNREDPEKLNEEYDIVFHYVTENILYLDKRDRADLQLCVTFLCTRVKDPDKYNWKRLNQVMRYIWSTIGLPHVISVDKMNMLWW